MAMGASNSKQIKVIFSIIFMILGVFLVIAGMTSSRPVAAATPVTVNWGNISPDISPDPDFAENAVIAPEINTNFSADPNPHLDPYHGLGSATGGLNGFDSQNFTNVGNSGVDITIHYSRNNYDGPDLEGPDLYQPTTNPLPDRRVMGEYALRVNRDPTILRTPTTIVLVFSESVYLDEFLVGSLSVVGSSHEHAIVRAFATADATGPVVKASEFINISNLDTCAPLLHDQCVNEGPTPINLLTNIAVDPDLIDNNNDGVYENVGSGADDGLYHVYGVIVQPDGYGRAKLVYDQLVRSIAVSYFPTSNTNPNPFTDTAYTDQWNSSILAPYTFTPQDVTAISMQELSATGQNSSLIVVGLVMVMLAALTGLIWKRTGLEKGK